jgi:glycosyltransferase involved in cell wall biosynthesis
VPLPPLALAGKIGWLADDVRAQVERGVARGSVRFLDYVPLEAMPALYTGAEAFLFVPLYEGYGMPAREALRCGTPVIASDIPALREATDGTALFAGPDERSIEVALRDFAVRARCPPRPNAAQFAQSDGAVERFAAVVDAVAARRGLGRAARRARSSAST